MRKFDVERFQVTAPQFCLGKRRLCPAFLYPTAALCGNGIDRAAELCPVRWFSSRVLAIRPPTGGNQAVKDVSSLWSNPEGTDFPVRPPSGPACYPSTVGPQKSRLAVFAARYRPAFLKKSEHAPSDPIGQTTAPSPAEGHTPKSSSSSRFLEIDDVRSGQNPGKIPPAEQMFFRFTAKAGQNRGMCVAWSVFCAKSGRAQRSLTQA